MGHHGILCLLCFGLKAELEVPLIELGLVRLESLLGS